MEVADAIDERASDSRATGIQAADPVTSKPKPSKSPAHAASKKKSSQARNFWMKQFHTWHWVSAAISLAAMLLFSITGITLNHAASISAVPAVTKGEGQLPPAILSEITTPSDPNAPLPQAVAKAVASLVPLDPSGRPADWSSEDEVYIAMPGPGRDAWVSIDRTTGAIASEVTDRGWVSYINDLHKGRNTGEAWFWFIDLFAIACIIFTLTGLLLLQLHAKRRPMTWPLVGLSLIAPVLLAILFIH